MDEKQAMEKQATEAVPIIKTAASLPPILVGRTTPAVAAQVESFYNSGGSPTKVRKLSQEL